MKFVDLDIGQQFEMEGERYIRTGPLVASHGESGRQRFMARYMVVKPLDAATAEVTRKPDWLSSDAVNRAFEIFNDHCLNLLGQLETELPPDRLSSIRTQLDQARQSFLDSLHKK
ncbi:MAG: hypothetical protein WC029_13920 [Sulfuricella sp.]|jgi:hypothetical protein